MLASKSSLLKPVSLPCRLIGHCLRAAALSAAATDDPPLKACNPVPRDRRCAKEHALCPWTLSVAAVQAVKEYQELSPIPDQYKT